MPDPEPPPSRRPVPTSLKAGAATIVIGLLFDLAEHTVAPGATYETGSGSLGQHVAHLVVLIGMVLVLAAIVRDGVRTSGRTSRQEGSARHAIR